LATVGHGGLVLLKGYVRHASLQSDDVGHPSDKAAGRCVVKPLTGDGPKAGLGKHCGSRFQLIYIIGIYHQGLQMAETGTAKIFKHGRSQAVRLPKEFRLPGTEVRVRRFGRGVLLEPIAEGFDLAAWWDKLDKYDGDFLPEGRPEQPPMPVDDRKYFDDE
jgi:antitoxin VapB